MVTDTLVKKPNLIVSEMAENLIGSEIIKIAADINEKIKNGERIYNLTIGDFDPQLFPIPTELNDEIIAAYNAKQTNYPAANGILELRKAVSLFLKERQNLSYSADEILISSGARPLIYGAYKTLIHPGDVVVFPSPSWNNNHYCHLCGATPIIVETKPENNFMPTADDLRPHLKGATLLALCSPLNPTGTVFTKEGLEEICDLVIEENRSRSHHDKPLYLLYDQIYWILTFGETKHFDPVTLRPELKDYTIFIDGLSKAFAATGVRVGWAFGPQRIIDKMKAILSHVGAWAPKAEQVASAKYLGQTDKVNKFLTSFKKNIDERLHSFYKGFVALKNEGHKVNAVTPQAAIYLTVQFDLCGLKTADGKILATMKDVTSYILEEAKMAIVPFFAFGSSKESTWFRISVGTCTMQEIDESINKLRTALEKLS